MNVLRKGVFESSLNGSRRAPLLVLLVLQRKNFGFCFWGCSDLLSGISRTLLHSCIDSSC